MTIDDKNLDILCELTLLLLSENINSHECLGGRYRHAASSNRPFSWVCRDFEYNYGMSCIKKNKQMHMLFPEYGINQLRKFASEKHGFKYIDRPIEMDSAMSEIIESLVKPFPKLHTVRIDINLTVPFEPGEKDRNYQRYAEYLLLSQSVSKIQLDNGKKTYYYVKNAYDDHVLNALVERKKLNPSELEENMVEFSLEEFVEARNLREKYFAYDEKKSFKAFLKENENNIQYSLKLLPENIVDELVLLVIYLCTFIEPEKRSGKPIYKSLRHYPVQILDELHLTGFLKPYTGNQFVYITKKGVSKGKELFEKYFGPKKEKQE